MSVDPGPNVAAAAASAAASASAAAIEALIATELQALAADAQALQSQVTAGQVVVAQVLPSNGLTDLINILGNRVSAALPPTLSPGDLFTAQVTGFNGTQILLQVLGPVDPAQVTTSGGAPPGLEAPPAPAPVPVSEPPASALQAAAARPPLPAEVLPSVAPPPAVFVAASVRPSVTLTEPPAAQPVQAAPAILADIEARLAAARAGAVSINVPAAEPPAAGAPALPNVPSPVANQAPAPPAAPPAAPPPGPPAGAPAAAARPPAPPAGPTPAPSSPTAAPAPAPAARFTPPPQITPSLRFGDPAAAAGTGGSAAARAATPSLTALRDPVALVRSLNLPVTPTNIAAARMALETPQRLPAALATLESALPQVDDPRVLTLRTLIAFAGKLDPASPQLAEQISAYVDNVVTGAEPKIAQLLLAAQQAAGAPEPPPDAAAPENAAPAGTAEPAAPPPPPAVAVLALAQAAERGAALAVDLKTQLLSLINSPPAGSAASEDLLPAATSAATAITAVQMNAAQAMNATPQTIAFTLPMWLGSGYAQAQIAIDRDAPEPGAGRALDGDNFHIAFVLDTKNLGIVTIDLKTVGRAFSLAVKTENEQSAQRFGNALQMLTQRLETLRYRVDSAEAGVAARGKAATVAAPPAAGAAAATAADEADAADGIATDVNVRA
jgi:hypothetical protein